MARQVTWIVVYDDDDTTAPMGWDADCDGALCTYRFAKDRCVVSFATATLRGTLEHALHSALDIIGLHDSVPSLNRAYEQLCMECYLRVNPQTHSRILAKLAPAPFQ